MVFSVKKATAAVAILAQSAQALSNTAPVMLLSDSKPLNSPLDDIDLVPTMEYVFDTSTAQAVKECQYDAYSFVKQSNVSEREVNRHSMPFLTHATEKAEGKYIQGTAIDEDDAQVDNAVTKSISSIESECGAVSVAIDSSKLELAAYSDTKPRVISVNFAQDTSSETADESIKHIVGHLPSKNFLLAYYTSPLSVRSSSEDDDPAPSGSPSAGSAPASSSSSSGEVPYESIFRNYQFFSPALFMGLIVSTFLIVVFIIAFRSVDSLQISQAAFEPRRDARKTK